MSLAYLYRVCYVLLERKCYFIHLILEINMVFNSFGVSLINVVLYKILLITFCASKSSIFCQNLSEHDLKYSRRFVHSDATRWTIEWVIAKSLLIGGGATTTMTHYLILGESNSRKKLRIEWIIRKRIWEENLILENKRE